MDVGKKKRKGKRKRKRKEHRVPHGGWFNGYTTTCLREGVLAVVLAVLRYADDVPLGEWLGCFRAASPDAGTRLADLTDVKRR